MKRTGKSERLPRENRLSEDRLIRGMNPALRAVYERIKARRDEMREKAVILTYEIGEEVLNIQSNHHKYGEKAVTELAVGLGMNPNMKRNPLAKARQIASAWSRYRIIELMEAAEEYGNEFTVSHFEELAVLRGEQGLKDRARLEDEVIRLGIPIRELHGKIVACTRRAIQSR